MGCAERFIRTLKENLLWVRTLGDHEEPREASLAFRKTYTTWLIERHGFLTPAQFRRSSFKLLCRCVGFNPVSQKPRAVHQQRLHRHPGAPRGHDQRGWQGPLHG